MRDVSHKITTKRTARAVATLTMSPSTMAHIENGTVPKGDPLPVAKVAAVMAAKKTTEWIPYCHNIPIEFVGVNFHFESDRVEVAVDVTSIAKTGVEMEAMTAASAAVLTLYDMLKMLDDDMEIVGVRLLEKRGGKSDFTKLSNWTARVIVASDRAARGDYQDVSGEVLREGLEGFGGSVSKVVVSDEVETLQQAIREGQGCNLILITGGTGLGSRDVTPEAVLHLLDRRLDGVEEALRAYGQIRFPLAMLSRSFAGVIGKSIVVGLPGSPSACSDALNALFPSLLHAIEVVRD